MNQTNDLETPTAEREGKAFATLAAQFALLGYVLIKGDPAIDGQALYYAMRLGTVQPLATLEAATMFLAGVLGTGDGGG
ncbi:hypothetical protein J2W49_001187 [Hydrogenophaga palleronii]|uniref:Uncharacterized protein n=1 Tax=Hydrogenophaga palleronii TaxID=65655 RepID=A0ABU1WIZ3_9BURK|nr:hypothetical protein [Hydrogenophaga palleronii]MDR7149238.1 hypothetical protein [Hydrogenophaga palleronii]